MPAISRRAVLALRFQRAVSWAFAPVWIPGCALLMRFGLRWWIRDRTAIRKRFRAELRQADGPVLVCANHLTMVDSAVMVWALAPSWWYLLNFRALPWNLPEYRNFAASHLMRVLVYFLKCIPIVRGGDRRASGEVLARLAWLLGRGDLGLVFPEGGRSRTGRVVTDTAAYGVGRLVTATPGTRVLCVYMRGARQASWSDIPAWGETFDLAFSWLEPRTEHAGLRGSVDISRQILERIAAMEVEYFNDRQ